MVSGLHTIHHIIDLLTCQRMGLVIDYYAQVLHHRCILGAQCILGMCNSGWFKSNLWLIFINFGIHFGTHFFGLVQNVWTNLVPVLKISGQTEPVSNSSDDESILVLNQSGLECELVWTKFWTGPHYYCIPKTTVSF